MFNFTQEQATAYDGVIAAYRLNAANEWREKELQEARAQEIRNHGAAQNVARAHATVVNGCWRARGAVENATHSRDVFNTAMRDSTQTSSSRSRRGHVDFESLLLSIYDGIEHESDDPVDRERGIVVGGNTSLENPHDLDNAEHNVDTVKRDTYTLELYRENAQKLGQDYLVAQSKVPSSLAPLSVSAQNTIIED